MITLYICSVEQRNGASIAQYCTQELRALDLARQDMVTLHVRGRAGTALYYLGLHLGTEP